MLTPRRLCCAASAAPAGVSHFANGNVYEGEWVDGSIDGYGTLRYADGDSYTGNWKHGKMHGEGRYGAACAMCAGRTGGAAGGERVASATAAI